ncbi:Os08g0507701, partial [Oryza sativa Japonica Group]
EDYRRALGHGVAPDLRVVLLRPVRHEDRRRRVQAHHLLHHGLEVRQLLYVVLLHLRGFHLAGEDVVHLGARLGHYARVAEQFRHRPLHRDGDRVGPGAEQVVHYACHVVASDRAGGHEVEEGVQEVACAGVGVLSGRGVGQAAVDYAVEDAEHLVVALLRPATPSLQVEPAEVEHATVHDLADVDHLPGVPGEVADDVPHLALPDAARRGEAPRGEDVGGRHAAQRLPARVGARQPYHGPAGEPARAGSVRHRARREAPVVLGERLPRRAGRRDDHGGDEAQLQRHHGAVLAGEARQSVVHVAAQAEHVADHRERRRARRQPPRSAAHRAGEVVASHRGGERCA